MGGEGWGKVGMKGQRLARGGKVEWGLHIAKYKGDVGKVGKRTSRLAKSAKVVKVGKIPYVERGLRPKVEGCKVGKVGKFPKFNIHRRYILELFEFANH